MHKLLATSDPQHCWRRVLCSSKTMRQHILLVTQSSFCAVRHPSSPVLTCGQLTVLASTSRLPHLGHAARARISSTNPRYGRVNGSVLLQHGLNFSIAWWTMQLIGGEKDWKHISMQKVVTLNTCCDVACLTFQLPHITTSSFQSHQCQSTTGSSESQQRFEECNITFSQMKKFCILHGSVMTFFRCGG